MPTELLVLPGKNSGASNHEKQHLNEQIPVYQFYTGTRLGIIDK
ncbi:hypothetical protein [Nitrosomonas ureae]|nr:hypothetical protein [Nitrosomonas ureae]